VHRSVRTGVRATASALFFFTFLAVPVSPAVLAQPAPFGHHVIVALNANQSGNWSGYNQGTLEQGTTLFSQVSANWTVPTATQHVPGRAEFSSSWIGIGGGCLDAACTATDNTLIQTGTEQDVAANGAASYSAWYELVPAPSLAVTMTIHPGDVMHADIHELVANSNVWSITITDTTGGGSFTTTVPYTSTHGTAEWIVETPVTIGTSGAGISAMPNLVNDGFTNAARNGVPAGLTPSEELQLVQSGQVIATPSAPSSNAFTVCTYSATC